MRPLLALALVWMTSSLHGDSGITQNAAEPRRVAVYPVSQAAHPARFTASVAGSELQSVEATAIDPERPLLLIIDPTSYAASDLGSQLARWGTALASSETAKQCPIRVGVAVRDGLLSDPIKSQAAPAALEHLMASYAAEFSQAAPPGPTRLLDLVVDLINKASTAGPIDCIVIAKDRQLPRETSPYLSQALGRRLSARLHASGSSIYAHLSGSGALSDLTADCGGRAFGADQSPESVLEDIGAARASGFVLGVGIPANSRFEGWLPLDIRATGADGTEIRLRSPRNIWWVRDGSAPPDCASVLRSLELLRHREASPTARGPSTGRDTVLQEALAVDPWNPAALVASAQTALADNDGARARRYGSRAIALLPTDSSTVKAYCDLALKSGDWHEASESINALKARGYLDSSVADRIMAGLLSGAGHYPEAAAIYERLSRSIADVDADLQAEYGWVLIKQGKNREAATLLASAQQGGSRSTRVLLGQSELAAASGKLDDALQLVNRVLQDTPEDQDFLMQKARLQLRRGEWAEAIASLDAAAAVDDSGADLALLRAEADIGAGRISEGAGLLSRATQMALPGPEQYVRLAGLQQQIGIIDGAARTLEAGAAATGTQTSALLLGAAELRERKGEFGQALLDYRAALLADPQNLSAGLASHVEFLTTMMGGADSTATRKKPQSSEAGGKSSDLLVPGGNQLLARILGVDPAALSRPDAAERLFAHILEMTPTDEKVRENPLAVAVVSSLKDYDALLKHLVKLRLIHPEQDLGKPADLVFPLAGPDVKLARTAEFLSFFGVHYKAARPEHGNIELTMGQSTTAESRLRLLRNMGVDLLNRNVREIRISIHNDRIPMLLGSNIWASQILRGTSDSDLLQHMVQSPDALRLYVALARCSSGLRQAVVESGLAGELLRLNRAIFVYGPSLEFKAGRLVLPGSREAWESVLGASSSNRTAFLSALLDRDQGRPLLLYQALSAAPEAVRRYLTSSPSRLSELYQLLAPYDSSRLASGKGDTGRQDFGRLLRQASADDRGIFFQVPAGIPRLLSIVREGGKGAALQSPPVEARYVDLPTLVGLMARGLSPTPTIFSTPIDTLEMLEYLKQYRPEFMGNAAVRALMQSPSQTPLYLDLVWYVNPDTDVTARYIAYCRSLAAAGAKGWNTNKTRTSQAFFYLLSALCREDIVDSRVANRILASALERFDTDDEGVFARHLAGILNMDILPAIVAATDNSAPDPVLSALARRPARQDIHFEGRYFGFDGPAFRARRMSAAIQEQTAPPLAKVLAAYRLLARLDASAADTAAAVELAKLLREIGTSQKASRPMTDSPGRIPRADTATLLQKIEDAVQKHEVPPAVRDQVAKALDVELGVSLLAYCYADNATQDAALLAFDPNFVRKHVFYPEATVQSGTWRRAYVWEDQQGGSIVTGSLAGLRDEVSRLETLQSGQSFGAQGAGLVPTLLSDLRSIPYRLRTDRAQEYVALSVRLGLELAVKAARDPELAAWLYDQAQTMLGPRRRELLLEWGAQPEPGPESQVFSRSELFLLGRSYLRGAGNVPEIQSPVLERLRSMTPAPGSADAAQFAIEVDQYGPAQGSRSGIDQPTFAFADSYEALETNVRISLLFERICDLKIRVAELNYAMGLPAALAGFEGELALKDIVPQKEELNPNSWRTALEHIARLDTSSARRWVEELSQRGCLNEKMLEQTEAREVRR